MLETLTIDTFAPHVGETFRLQVAPTQALDLELVQVAPLTAQTADGTDATRARQPFSLMFRGPAHVVAPQRIYPLEHAAIGTCELFVVPLGPGQGGMLYEIIFT